MVTVTTSKRPPTLVFAHAPNTIYKEIDGYFRKYDGQVFYGERLRITHSPQEEKE